MEEQATAQAEQTIEKSKEADLLYNQLATNAEEQYVTFTLDKEEYGIKVLSVQEIVSVPEITSIPNTPPYIKGLINLRGSVTPLVDLRTKFRLAEKDVDRYTVVIVVNVNEKTIGIIVDKVSDVLSFNAENLQDAPNFSASIQTQFIEKMGNIEDRLVILLNIGKVLSDEELDSVEKIRV